MRGLVVALVPALLAFHTGTAAGIPPQMIVFNGICDASAGVALDESRIVVGDDEQPWLSVYRLDGGEPDATIPLQQAAPDGDGDAPEADLEGATVLDGRIVWISSNGRNKNGKVRPERFQLFASHRLAGQEWSEELSPSFSGLPKAVAATHDASYAPLRAAIGDLDHKDEDLAPKKHGFNVEGLTVTEDGRYLLVGLRNPHPGGNAVLFRLDNAEDLLDGTADRAVLGPIVKLDLGKRGIRDIAWSPALNAYLVAAGQTDDEDRGPGFALFTWDGSADPKEIEGFRAVLDAHPAFHPEAVVPLLERSGSKLEP